MEVSNKPWPKELCTQENINKLMVQNAKKLADDGYSRCCNHEKVIEIAHKGFWSANQNYLNLKSCLEIETLETKKREKHQKFLDWHIQHGSYFIGYPPKGFEMIDNLNKPYQKEGFVYVLQAKGLSAKEGLESAVNSLGFFTSPMFTQIIYYQTLLEIGGEQAFNNYFAADGVHPLSFNPQTLFTPIANFLHFLPFPPKEGGVVWFGNHPMYCRRHDNGEDAVFHLVCTEEQPECKFTGFGFSGKGHSEEEIYERAVNVYNSRPLTTKELINDEIMDHYELRVTNNNGLISMTKSEPTRIMLSDQKKSTNPDIQKCNKKMEKKEKKIEEKNRKKEKKIKEKNRKNEKKITSQRKNRTETGKKKNDDKPIVLKNDAGCTVYGNTSSVKSEVVEQFFNTNEKMKKELIPEKITVEDLKLERIIAPNVGLNEEVMMLNPVMIIDGFHLPSDPVKGCYSILNLRPASQGIFHF